MYRDASRDAPGVNPTGNGSRPNRMLSERRNSSATPWYVQVPGVGHLPFQSSKAQFCATGPSHPRRAILRALGLLSLEIKFQHSQMGRGHTTHVADTKNHAFGEAGPFSPDSAPVKAQDAAC